MVRAQRKEFSKFYRKDRRKKRNIFNFDEEFMAYCKQDVEVLRLCCQELRKLFSEITGGLCPFTSSLTVAGMCSFFWRTTLLKEEDIALLPKTGKAKSKKAMQWLHVLANEEGIDIEHEYRIGKFTVDGYCAANNTVYEFLGCFYHGCPTHTLPDTIHPLLNIRMADLHEQTMHRNSAVEALGYTVEVYWEHDFDKRCLNDEDFADAIQIAPTGAKLEPRDAFYGGRTNALKLYHKVQEGETIRYVDFISLYPSVNKYKTYPVGPFQCIRSGFGKVEQYFGLIRLSILPPQDLYLPVLPYRSKNKLTFPLCRTCVDERLDAPCKHTPADRTITGTWCTVEVLKAIEKGYQVVQIDEVWHYDRKREGLFAEYVDTFLKLKVEASGFPAGCQTEEHQDSYIAEFRKQEGIQLEKEKIAKNAGMRTFAKLCLNSFWGRLGMQDSRVSTVFLKSVEQFYRHLLSDKFTVHTMDLFTEEIMQLTYTVKADYIATNPKTNVILAAFTTAWARLVLYEALDAVAGTVMYFDTDSIIYSHRPGQPELPLGQCLGDLSSELPDGQHITEIVCLAPKCYAYITSGNKQVVKVKDFTLNGRSRKQLNFENFMHLLLQRETGKECVTVNYPFNIKKDKKTLLLHAVEMDKRLRFVYDKRRMLPDYRTLPFGYYR